MLQYWIDSGIGGGDTCDLGKELEWVSKACGYASITFWVIVGLPQMYENYKQKSGESLSVFFLLIWLIGDFFNIAGAILLQILLPMILVGVWYGIMDIVLLFQIYYYRRTRTKNLKYNSINHADSSEEESSSDDSDSKPFFSTKKSKSSLNMIGIVLMFSSLITIQAFHADISQTSSRSLLSLENASGSGSGSGSDEKTLRELLGEIFGWTSVFFYVGSRIPQIYKNYVNKSCEGLSVWLFLFAVLANLFYTAQVFLCSVDIDYILKNLPFVAGSVGTLGFDFVIFFQFFYYRSPKL